jgi:hypothetical protein
MHIFAPIGHPEGASVARLRQWSVSETRDSDGRLVHLAMSLLNDNESRMRVKSPVVRFEGGQILTESGSIYSLVGPPATAVEMEHQSSPRAALSGRAAVDVAARYGNPIGQVKPPGDCRGTERDHP